MRQFKHIVLLITTVSLISFASCSTDEGGEAGNAASGTLTAKVDGTSFASLEISSSATIANGGQNLIIIATNSDGNAFSFTILGYDGVGTYPIGGGANIFNSASYSETEVNLSNPTDSITELWQAPYDDTIVGELKVSEQTDSKVIGTFSFQCKNVNGDNSIKSITEGSFNLNKQTL
ncbi:MAG: hypothetical protein GW839_06375 [Flavobacteriales bacterium]|nr:hypothetical protein [Flavobacteriia bacterium]NCP05788.1 hypothetical protein [Flavobacteriales bacterium]PIV94476.1 MAG: hypothetical protein COW44_03905 [Flavobacteriaceae bacterium CG17_big_fil_post_rev_8_21_14_2_50_33_15]PIY11288.1 MAG: hypothetical protein COZ17_07215 [Flavobacteriaceae bacterium CG_4_10_14_3_um_filter_33_47]PJB20641.1 MAG: hypothetical protein CO117_00300 [Flavobacteriaceae bacterium CG_4_9_14_3_um_filter_33_16]